MALPRLFGDQSQRKYLYWSGTPSICSWKRLVHRLFSLPPTAMLGFSFFLRTFQNLSAMFLVWHIIGSNFSAHFLSWNLFMSILLFYFLLLILTLVIDATIFVILPHQTNTACSLSLTCVQFPSSKCTIHSFHLLCIEPTCVQSFFLLSSISKRTCDFQAFGTLEGEWFRNACCGCQIYYSIIETYLPDSGRISWVGKHSRMLTVWSIIWSTRWGQENLV